MSLTLSMQRSASVLSLSVSAALSAESFKAESMKVRARSQVYVERAMIHFALSVPSIESFNDS